MGIPAFYWWLMERYRRSIVDVVEDSPAVINGVKIPIDTTKPNPNGFEFDNLYLDMNGIIHPCFHPEKLPSPQSYDEVLIAVFKYIDRIFSLIRPRKLLYMAIDGVAPRAKMNQQRARRFRAAKDAADEDADLIMLALASHEVHFSILREDVRKLPAKGQDHNIKRSAENGKLRRSAGQICEDFISRLKFQFINVWILRDYLAESLRISDPTVKFDLERLIDDFVFMCLFVGNDFLPHVPSLEISEGALDLLMVVYKREFVRMGGYLTDSFQVNLKRVDHFMRTLASHEDAIFEKRRQEQIVRQTHARRFPAKVNSSGEMSRVSSNQENSKGRFVVDKVNLGEDGWKERYYSEKFEVQTDDDRERVQKDAVLKYVEGICWVMHYYYQGVCSWQWFYPYHYAPFASDFHGLDKLEVDFALGRPFKPFDQLMSVLPAASAQALPLLYRDLMTNPSSPILDFYPTEFELDLNGRKQDWKAVCRLPFIDENRLLTEISKVEHSLTDAERRRNILGLDKIFIDMSHPLAAKILTFLERNKYHPKLHKAKVKRKINPKLSGGMNGYIYISDKPICPTEISSPLRVMKKTVIDNKVMLVFYKCPHFHPHIA